MAAVTITRKGDWVHVLVDPSASPAELIEAVRGHADLKGPVMVLVEAAQPWAAALVAHEAHATNAVAVWAEELAGYVVVQDHGAGHKVGEVLKREVA